MSNKPKILLPNQQQGPTAQEIAAEQAAMQERLVRFEVIARGLGISTTQNGSLPMDVVLLALVDRIQNLDAAVVKLIRDMRELQEDEDDENAGDTVPGHPDVDEEPGPGGALQ